MQKRLHATILLESRTLVSLLTQVLGNFRIDTCEEESSLNLLDKLADQKHPDLLFIGKESAIKENLTPFEFIAKLRAVYHGPILLITTNDDIDQIESYVSSGVTDVFSMKEIEQIENFVSNLISYHESVADVSNAKVLLVEDSKSMRDVISDLFERNDIEVSFVATGREALTVLHFEQVDLVITDYMLEGDMTGLALIRNIRRTTQWYSLPILAISGYQDPERNKELLRNGVSDVMYKPFDPELLLMKSKLLIQNKRTFQHMLAKQTTINEMLQKDALTGLYNRSYLAHFCERELTNQQSDRTKHLFLVHIDCDDFKNVNMAIGHDLADKVLIELGLVLRQYTPSDAVLARLDGDEFMIAIPNAESDVVLQVADLLRESVSNHDFFGTRFTVSAGVAGSEPGKNFSELYFETDKAVMRAKSAGKNKVMVCEYTTSLLGFG